MKERGTLYEQRHRRAERQAGMGEAHMDALLLGPWWRDKVMFRCRGRQPCTCIMWNICRAFLLQHGQRDREGKRETIRDGKVGTERKRESESSGKQADQGDMGPAAKDFEDPRSPYSLSARTDSVETVAPPPCSGGPEGSCILEPGVSLLFQSRFRNVQYGPQEHQSAHGVPGCLDVQPGSNSFAHVGQMELLSVG